MAERVYLSDNTELESESDPSVDMASEPSQSNEVAASQQKETNENSSPKQMEASEGASGFENAIDKLLEKQRK